MKHRLVEVDWDIDDAGPDIVEFYKDSPDKMGPPEIVNVPHDIEEEFISDWLSDEFGWCHYGWSWYSPKKEAETPVELEAYSADPI